MACNGGERKIEKEKHEKKKEKDKYMQRYKKGRTESSNEGIEEVNEGKVISVLKLINYHALNTYDEWKCSSAINLDTRER